MTVSSTLPADSKVVRFRHLIAQKKLQVESPHNHMKEGESPNQTLKPSTENVSSENDNPNLKEKTNHLTAMRKIMKRRNNSSAFYELGNTRVENAKESFTVKIDCNEVEDKNIDDNCSDVRDTSTWAMMGNHLNESNNENESFDSLSRDATNAFQSFDLTTTPTNWKLIDLHEKSPDELDEYNNASEILEFLNPLLTDEKANFVESIEKIEPSEMMTKSAGNNSTSIKLSKENDKMECKKAVKWEAQQALETPKNSIIRGSVKFRKSPFIGKINEMTPVKDYFNGTPTPQMNSMNESAVISDDEEDENSTRRNATLSSSANKNLQLECNFDKEESFDYPPSIKQSLAFDEDSTHDTCTEIPGIVTIRRQDNEASKKISPTRAALLERNHTLVKEVRFADQTCVELSEKNKYYKSEMKRLRQLVGMAEKENAKLRKDDELSMQEFAKLKALLESMKAQRDQAYLQTESYRSRIADLEEIERSNTKVWEERYQSHLKHSEIQVISLNERLAQILSLNSSLQEKLEKWESKLLEKDESNTELISSLKERITFADFTTKNTDAAMQAMQVQIHDLKELCNQQQNMLQREQNERVMIEHDRDDLQKQVEDFHNQLTDWNVICIDTPGYNGSVNYDIAQEMKFTPIREVGTNVEMNNSVSCQTPTSNLLGRTLRSELKRRHDILDQLAIAEHKVEKLHMEMSELRMDLEETKAENELLQDDLQEKCAVISETEEQVFHKEEQINKLLEKIAYIECNKENSGEESHDATKRNQEILMIRMQETIALYERRLKIMEKASGSTKKDLHATMSELASTQLQLVETTRLLTEKEHELTKADNEILKCDEQQNVSNLKLNEVAENLQEKNDDKSHLKTCLDVLIRVEKILRTYEDSDNKAKQKLGEYSRKILLLDETIKLVTERLSPRDAESLPNASLQSTLSHLLAHSVVASASIHNKSDDTFSEIIYKKKLSHLHDELDIMNERFDEKKKEINDVSDELEKALNCLQQYRVELSTRQFEHAKEKTELRNQLEAISKDNEILVHSCHKMEAQVTEVVTELNKYKEKNKVLQEKIAVSMNEADNDLSILGSNNSDILKENERLRVDFQALQIQLENEQSLLKASRVEITGFHRDMDAAKAAFECLQVECNFIKTTLRNMEQEKEELQQKMMQKDDELKKCHEKFAAEKESFSGENTKLSSMIHSLKKCCDDEKKESQDIIQSLEVKVSELKQENIEAEASLVNAMNRIELLENMIILKEQESKLVQEECRDFSIQHKNMEEEFALVQNKLFEAEKEIAEAKGTIFKGNKIIDQLTAKVEESKLCMGVYEDSVVEYKEKVQHLQSQVSSLQLDIKERDINYQSIMREKENHIEMLQKACSYRQALFDEQLINIQQERQTVTASNDAMLEKLQVEIQFNNECLEKSKALIAAKQSSLFVKESTINDCNLLIDSLQAELNEQKQTQLNLKTDVMQKQRQIETLQIRLKEIEDVMSLTNNKVHSLEVANEDLMRSKAATQQELESTLMDIQRMKTIHQDEKESSIAFAKNLENENVTLVAQKKSLEYSAETLAEERDTLQDELHHITNELRTVEEIMKQQLNNISELTDQNTSLNKKSNIFKEKMKHLNQKVRDWEDSYRLQGKDLVDYGREVLRLNVLCNALKAELSEVRTQAT